jgi:orotidine-5'-phosphate decarboxylase
VISSSGADFLTIHAVKPVMEAAVAGRADSLKLLGVTVLTSFDEQDIRDDGSALSLAELVEKRVGHAIGARMDGIVCSSLEVAKVRAMTGPKMTLVIPGVRSAGRSAGDQKRVATPADAIASGADYLVIGRQVTRAEDPRGELLTILDEIHTCK